jgi:hypothetical protein
VASTPEGKLKTKLRDLLSKRGIFHYVAAAGPYAQHGIPDIVAVWEGRAFYIEVKAPGKRSNTTPNQDRMLRLIAEAGGISCVVDDIQQLSEILNAGAHQPTSDPLSFKRAPKNPECAANG